MLWDNMANNMHNHILTVHAQRNSNRILSVQDCRMHVHVHVQLCMQGFTTWVTSSYNCPAHATLWWSRKRKINIRTCNNPSNYDHERNAQQHQLPLLPSSMGSKPAASSSPCTVLIGATAGSPIWYRKWSSLLLHMCSNLQLSSLAFGTVHSHKLGQVSYHSQDLVITHSSSTMTC